MVPVKVRDYVIEQGVSSLWKYAALLLAGIVIGAAPSQLRSNPMTLVDVDKEITIQLAGVFTQLTKLSDKVDYLTEQMNDMHDHYRKDDQHK